MNLDQLIQHLESLRSQIGGDVWVETENCRTFSESDITIQHDDDTTIVQIAFP
jgi:hypothetical protein